MDIEKILNKRSNAVVTDGGVETPVKPTSNQLDNGEIAVNYHKGTERLFIKNDNEEVVEFVSKDEVDKKQDKVDGVNIVRKEFEDDYGTYTEGVIEIDNGVYNAMLRNNQIIFTYDSDKGGIFFEPIGHTIDDKHFPGGVKCKHKKTDDPLNNDLRIARMCDLPSVTPQVQSDWNETNTTSKAYILNKPTIPTITYIIEHTTEETTIDALTPNVLHKWGTMTSLTISALATPSDETIVNEYLIEFTSGSTATVLSLPSSIVWAETPDIEANATYQISIINNLGIIVKFS